MAGLETHNSLPSLEQIVATLRDHPELAVAVARFIKAAEGDANRAHQIVERGTDAVRFDEISFGPVKHTGFRPRPFEID